MRQCRDYAAPCVAVCSADGRGHAANGQRAQHRVRHPCPAPATMSSPLRRVGVACASARDAVNRRPRTTAARKGSRRDPRPSLCPGSSRGSIWLRRTRSFVNNEFDRRTGRWARSNGPPASRAGQPMAHQIRGPLSVNTPRSRKRRSQPPPRHSLRDRKGCASGSVAGPRAHAMRLTGDCQDDGPW